MLTACPYCNKVFEGDGPCPNCGKGGPYRLETVTDDKNPEGRGEMFSHKIDFEGH